MNHKNAKKIKNSQKTKCFLENKLEEIKQEYKFYKKHLEKHPDYGAKWQIFWQKRYKELRREKIDPDSYDYRDEWKVYWLKYIHKLYEKKIAEVKEQGSKDSSIMIIDTSNSSSSSSSSSSTSSSDLDTSEREKERHVKRKSKTKNEDSNQNYAYSPISSDSDNCGALFEPVTLVSILRILSVFDTELGVLAGKVIDLLSQSLYLEKTKPNSSEILLSNDTIIFLETISEKLKGLLFTSLMPANKISTAKKSIQSIARLVYETSRLRKIDAPIQPYHNPCIASKFDENKWKLAEMIAQDLIALGKNDATPSELEAIIDSYLDHFEIDTENRKSEGFSDKDLQLLIENFKKLSEDEQHHLIKFFEVMEKNDPGRIERLKRCLDKIESANSIIKTDENSNIMTTYENDDDDNYNIEDLISSINKN